MKEEYPYEYDGPPLAINNVVHLSTTGDVTWVDHDHISMRDNPLTILILKWNKEMPRMRAQAKLYL